MPRNAAPKKHARQVSGWTGLRYSAALRLLESRPALADMLWPGTWPTRFARPIGLVADGGLPGPFVRGGSAFAGELQEIRLAYGLVARPEILITTRHADPETPDRADRLALDLANLLGTAAAVDAAASAVGFRDRMGLIQDAAPERIMVWLGGEQVPADRLRSSGFEAVEIRLDTVTVTCGGPEGFAQAARFELFGARAAA